MKLLILSTIPVPYRTAVLCGLSRYYETDIFFERCYDQNRNQKYFVEQGGFYLLDTEESQKRYKDCLKRLREYDLVLAYDYTSRMGMELMLRCIVKRVPYALNCDGAFINPNFMKDHVKRFFVRRAALYFASGPSAKDYFLHYGAEEERIYYHEFTSLTEADIRTAVPAAEEKSALRRKYDLPSGVLVLTIGQFIYRKGFDILLRAWNNMPSESHLLIVGGGEKEEEYRAYICDHHLTGVSLIGFLDKETLKEYYAASDIFVLPTREDVWGLVVNEAMACGLPVIATDMCIAGRELIQNEKNGYVVPVQDEAALREKMVRLICDGDLRVRMGKNNLERMKENTLENIVEAHRKAIDDWQRKRK